MTKLSRTFGKASDFYRVRIITFEEEIPPDFDWRDDVLYRASKEDSGKIEKKYALQVVELDSRNHQKIEEYAELTVANRIKQELQDDLEALTKIQFDKKYDLHFENQAALGLDYEGIYTEDEEFDI